VLTSSGKACEWKSRPNALSVHLSSQEVFLCIDLQFMHELRSGHLAKVVDVLEREIQQQQPGVGQIYRDRTAQGVAKGLIKAIA
jgi:hypothetical protein